MLNVPASLSQMFETHLIHRNVLDQQRRDFRYYLDFLRKVRF